MIEPISRCDLVGCLRARIAKVSISSIQCKEALCDELGTAVAEIGRMARELKESDKKLNKQIAENFKLRATISRIKRCLGR